MIRSRAKILLGMSLLAVFPLAWAIYPAVIVPTDFTVCVFRTLTKLECPFCGLTRALASAMHGNFQAAFAFHPLWWLAAVLIAGTGILTIFDSIDGGSRLGRLLRYRTRAIDLFIILALTGFWIYRTLW